MNVTRSFVLNYNINYIFFCYCTRFLVDYTFCTVIARSSTIIRRKRLRRCGGGGARSIC